MCPLAIGESGPHHSNMSLKKLGSKVGKIMHNMVQGIYLQNGEPSKILSESSLIIFTKSRLNLNPEKLHSEGKANRLYAPPAIGKVHSEIVSKTPNKTKTIIKYTLSLAFLSVKC